MSANDQQPLARNDGHGAERLAQLHGLIDRLCDLTPTAAEFAELDVMLKADESLRQHYLQHMSMHMSMQNGAGNLSHDAAGDLCALAPVASSRGGRGFQLAATLAVAATVLAVLAAAALNRGATK